MGVLSLNDVIKINRDMIRLYGGMHNGGNNICNLNSLLYALNAVQNGYLNDIECAALLLENIACRHCFYDGNKRTAVFVALCFLECLGYDVLIPDYQEMRAYVIGLIEHTVTRNKLVTFLTTLIVY